MKLTETMNVRDFWKSLTHDQQNALETLVIKVVVYGWFATVIIGGIIKEISLRS